MVGFDMVVISWYSFEVISPYPLRWFLEAGDITVTEC
jgi:hypothetical protein